MLSGNSKLIQVTFNSIFITAILSERSVTQHCDSTICLVNGTTLCFWVTEAHYKIILSSLVFISHSAVTTAN